MALIEIAIRERQATLKNAETVMVCNNPADTIRFDFDAEWSEHKAKTARFAWEGKYIDVAFSGNEVEVPEIYHTNYVNVGVYTDGLTSAYAKVRCKFSIKCLGGIHPAPPDDVYNKIIAMLNDIKSDKLSDEQIEAAVSKYLTENPITPGATAEEAAQIQQNADAIEDLQKATLAPDGKTLLVENGILRVNTADTAEGDNTLPITSAAVATQVGNIEILLKTI